MIRFALTLGAVAVAAGQTPEQVRTAFKHLRSDRTPGNGSAAAEWIFANRNRLKDQLVEELYRTDRQGRDVILFSLFHADGFKPDARFNGMVISRINEEDKYVGNSDLHIGGHWRAWEYIDRNYPAYKPAILENLKKTRSMLAVWATAWMLHWKGDLGNEVANFDANVWKLAATSMGNDEVSYNASQAVRFYLIVGKPSLPHLQEILKKGDKQASALAKATIDAMGGKREAYGYLGAKLNLDCDLLSKPGKKQPEWLNKEIEKFLDH